MHPLISVIIPVFNAKPYIYNTIQSVLNQTFTDFELIIINDGSTDETEKIIEAITDDRICYYSKKNEGQCKTLNLGLSVSRGQYIKFLDSDDCINLTHLESFVLEIQRLTADEQKQYLFLCKWQRFSAIRDEWPMNQRPEWSDNDPLSFIEKALGNGPDMLPAWQWLIPKNLLELSGHWNEELTLGNDFEFSIRLILASKRIIFCQDAIVYYRSDSIGNMSSDTKFETLVSVYKSAQLGINNILAYSSAPTIKRACADKLRIWLITYYPFIEEKFIRKVEKEIGELGGSSIDPGWSFKMRVIEVLFGWKIARMLQYYFYRLSKYFNYLMYNDISMKRID
jgi:glycosyltransferase involved in cell wall biosynthesis